MALLSLAKTRDDCLAAIERIASHDMEIKHLVAPEPPIVLSNEFGVTEWTRKVTAINKRSNWISRFERRMDQLEIVEPKPSKEVLRAAKLQLSGWYNCPVEIKALPSPIRTRDQSIDSVMTTTSVVDEESNRQLFCSICWGGVSSSPSARICCNHCFTVAHASCLASSSSSAGYTCAFCRDDFSAFLGQSENDFKEKLKTHARQLAAIKLQTFLRANCKRRWFLRIESALRTIQRAIRQKIYYISRSKKIRETLRPLRLRFHSVVLYGGGDSSTTDIFSKPLEQTNEVIGTIPSAFYESKLGCNASPKAQSDDTEVMSILKSRHQCAPEYFENPPSSHKFLKGEFLLVVTANEATNSEKVFDVERYKIMRNQDKRILAELWGRKAANQRRRLKQLYRLDIPLDLHEEKSVTVQGRVATRRTFRVQDARDYALLSSVSAMVDLTLSIVQVREWPRCEILGQAFINLQAIQKRKQTVVLCSHFSVNENLWHIPQVGGEGTKMSISKRNGSLAVEAAADAAAQAEVGLARVMGALTWTCIAHTDECSNHAGWIYTHMSPSLNSGKRRVWAVLIDKILHLFTGSSNKSYKKFEIAKCNITSAEEGEMIRIKTPLDTTYFSCPTTKDARLWSRKLTKLQLK